MKRIKLISSIVFIITLVFSSSIIPVNAKVNYDLTLQKRGFPSDYLELISLEDKIELYNNGNAIYAGKTVETFQVIETLDGNNDITIYATIPSSTLQMTVYQTVVKSGSNLQEIKYTAEAKWLSKPFWTQSDKVGFTWDNSNLRYKDNSFKLQVLNASNNALLSSTTVLSNAGVGSFAGTAVLSANYTSKIVTNFSLTPISSTTTGSNQVQFQYAHQIGVTGITVTLPTGYGGSISFSGSYDQAAITKTVSY